MCKSYIGVAIQSGSNANFRFIRALALHYVTISLEVIADLKDDTHYNRNGFQAILLKLRFSLEFERNRHPHTLCALKDL